MSLQNNITEETVVAWLLEQIAQINADGLPVHNLSISANTKITNDGSSYVYWCAHAAGHCVTSATNMASAFEQLRRDCLDHPEDKARDKRAEAARLLSEAAALEAIDKRR